MSKLQTVSPRRNNRITRHDAQFGGSVEIGWMNETAATDAYFKLPHLTTTQRNALTAEEGMVVYDTTLGKVYVYNAGGWGSTDGTAAGSLDAAYNGGSSVTVDASALTLTSSLTDAALAVVANSVVTGDAVTISATALTEGNALKISAVEATLTSGFYLALYDGAANDFTVGKYGAVVIAGNAATDVLTLTAGHAVITSGNLTLSSGNVDVTGTLAISSTSTLSGAVTMDSTAVIDVTNANAFKVRKNGTGTTILNIDTTGDAGDTEFTLVSEPTSGIGISFTPATTTGSGLYIDASTVTSGDAVLIKVVSGTMTAAGSAISVLDGSTEVFAVRDDGSIYSKSTAEGTTAFQVVTGDVLISDGDLTIAGGEVAFTSNANAAGVVIANNTLTTANQLVGVSSTSITTGALMTLNANTAAHDGEVLEVISAGDATSTPVGISVTIASPTTGATRGIEVTMVGATTTAKGIAVTMDALTTGDMLYLDNGGGTMTGDGKFINCNDDNVSAFSVSAAGATIIAGAAAGTAALTLSLGDLVITDTDASTIHSVNGTGTLLTLDNEGGVIASDTAVLSLDAGGAVASGGNILRIAPTGTPNAGAIGIEYVGASKAMTAMYIDGDSTASDVVTINGGGVLTDNNGVLVVMSDGAIATGGNTFRVETAGTPASGAIYAEFNFTGITDTNENVGVMIDAGGKKVVGLHVDADPIAGDVVYFHSDAVIADNKGVLQVHSAGAIASGSNALRVEVDGTPASGAIYGEFDFTGITDTNENVGVKIDAGGKKVVALYIDADPAAGSVAYMHTDVALAADKAVLELNTETGAGNSDSSVLRVEQGNASGVSFCVTLKQDDQDQMFLNYEGTSAADQTKSISTVNGDGTVEGPKNYSASAGWAFTGMVKCAVNGTAAWIPYYVADAS